MTDNALVAQTQTVTPMRLIEMAAERGASIEQMAQLFELKLRVEADEARKAYDEAISLFKAELPRITKNITVNDGPLKGKKYADLYAVVSAITPNLSLYGLSASWKLTRDEPGWIEVTCSIRHKQGHSEAVSMGGPPDAGGAKNAIQSRASTVNYLERYTLLAAIGTSAAGEDTDANAPTANRSESMSDQEFIDHQTNIENAPTLEELHRFYLAAVKAAKVLRDTGAEAQFIKMKDARKKELK